MAVIRTDKGTKLRLKLDTGTDPDTGGTIYASRNINDINPNLTDGDAKTVGDEIGGIYKDTLTKVSRVDTVTLEPES